MKHHQESDTSFVGRSWAMARRHSAVVIVSTICSLVTGTIIPTVQEWHDQKVIYQAIDQVKADCVDQIKELKQDFKDALAERDKQISEMQHEINRLQDRTITVPYMPPTYEYPGPQIWTNRFFPNLDAIGMTNLNNVIGL